MDQVKIDEEIERNKTIGVYGVSSENKRLFLIDYLAAPRPNLTLMLTMILLQPT